MILLNVQIENDHSHVDIYPEEKKKRFITYKSLNNYLQMNLKFHLDFQLMFLDH